MNQDSSIERAHYQHHLDSITSSISRRRNLDRISSRLEPKQREKLLATAQRRVIARTMNNKTPNPVRPHIMERNMSDMSES